MTSPSPPGHAPASAESLPGVAEEMVVSYSNKIHGVPPDCVLLKGDPLFVDTPDAMNSLLASKAIEAWSVLRHRHVWVLRSGTAQGEDQKSFLYVVVAVAPRADDTELVRCKHAHDIRLLRPLQERIARGMMELFRSMTTISEAERQQMKPLFSWTFSDPQVVPRIAGWTRYDTVRLHSAQTERPAKKKRPLAPLDGTQGEGPGTLAAGIGQLPAETRALSEPDACAVRTAQCRVRCVRVASGERTHVYVHGDSVYIVEH